jgi:hypothetical protein
MRVCADDDGVRDGDSKQNRNGRALAQAQDIADGVSA